MKKSIKRKSKILNLLKTKKMLLFLYLLIFLVFMGSNFLGFTVFGVNFNIARSLMIIASIIAITNIGCYIFKKNDIRKYIKNKKVGLCLSFFIIWSLISVVSIFKNLDFNMYLIINFFICCGTLCMILFCKKLDVHKNYKTIFNLITIPLLLNCLYYFYLYFIKNKNIGGWYHNTNDLATVLLLGIPIVIYLFFNTKNKKQKIFYLITLILYLFSFKLTLSRASLLGLIFSIFTIVIIYIIKNRKKLLNTKTKKIICFSLAIVLLILGISAFIYYIGDLDLSPEKSCNSNQVRINLIYNAFHFLKNDANWLFGIGAGNSIYYLKNFSVYPICNFFNFHNFWLDILVGYGIVIFIGFLISYFIMCKEIIKKIGKKFKLDINIIFIFFLFAFLIACISSSSILTRAWLWITFAMILSYLNHEKANK